MEKRKDEQRNREKKALLIDIGLTAFYITVLLIIFIIFYNLTT